MKKLLLLDGMAAVYRAYFALGKNPRLTSRGFNTSCILGFSTTLYDLLASQQPTHVGVAFDLPKPTFRHELYPEYKANRPPTPEVIHQSIPYVRQMIEAFRIPILTCEGYEADDVIGTLSHQAELAGFDDVLMATPDKDYAQLVTPTVRIYRFGRGRTPDAILGVQEVCDKFDISTPHQVIDLLGLWGDSVDNIPGIRGVGEKTAKKLIAQFGSIEAMVQRSDEIANDRVRQMVKEHSEDALFSKRLATISLDAPVAFDEESLLRRQPDYEQLQRLCEELEFRQFARRVMGSYAVAAAPTPSTASASTPQPATDSSQLSLFGAPASVPQPVEQNSQPVPPALQVSPLTAEVLRNLCDEDLAIYLDEQILAIATDADHAWMASLSSFSQSEASANPLAEALFVALQNQLSTKLCFDLKALKYALSNLKIELRGNIFDLQLAHYLLDAEVRHTFDAICLSMLDFSPQEPAVCAAALWQLYPIAVARLKDSSLGKLYSDIELPLVDVLISMEREGVRIDADALRQYSATLTSEIAAIEKQIYALAGASFNINSPRQLGEVLYEKLKVTDKPPRTATKQYSTAEEVLQKLADRHAIIPLILEYRSLSKLTGTYLDALPRLISPIDHRLHTVYNQTVTATGRLSSSSPNLQNIPIRTDRGRPIRRAFVPRDEEHLLMAADYSQIELRIIASLSQDEHLLAAFNHGQDIHAATAARIYHVDLDAVTPDQRRNAKSVNFGIVYGISAFGLSEQLAISRREAAALIEEYFGQYPGVASFIETSKQFAREHGYARTILGRRRYLPDINSRNPNSRAFAERNAVNMPIQGTSADMIKLAMVRIHQELLQRQFRSRLILQVHDELVLDLYRPEEEPVRELVLRHMQTALPLEGLAVEVSVGVASDWLAAH